MPHSETHRCQANFINSNIAQSRSEPSANSNKEAATILIATNSIREICCSISIAFMPSRTLFTSVLFDQISYCSGNRGLEEFWQSNNEIGPDIILRSIG